MEIHKTAERTVFGEDKNIIKFLSIIWSLASITLPKSYDSYEKRNYMNLSSYVNSTKSRGEITTLQWGPHMTCRFLGSISETRFSMSNWLKLSHTDKVSKNNWNLEFPTLQADDYSENIGAYITIISLTLLWWNQNFHSNSTPVLTCPTFLN